MTDFHWAILALAAPFLAAPCAALLGRKWGAIGAGFPVLIAAAAGFSALIRVKSSLPTGARHPIPETSVPWIPEYGLDFALNLDGYGIFFALLVLGLGFLIALYGIGYMAHESGQGRFFAYFALFMGSMVGLVLADDLLLAAVFWEMTSITSFLLIGFKHEKEESRRGAMRALLITFVGGLCLLGAAVLLRLDGFSSLSGMIADPSAVLAAPSATPALLLLLLAAFTKSAQFPFHIWLPGAMAAPTPVSAYLHSATMVKAGVYLAGRIYPIFSEHPLWGPLLAGVGLTTMVVGAWLALGADDLKAILAYSTISQLGLLFGVYGLAALPGVDGLRLDLFHITSHAFYKAALFMLAGIVDHETGTRSAARLGGLLRAMPRTGAILIVACACLASLPPTTGFISKEAFIASLLNAGGVAAALGIAAVLFAATSTVFFALRLSAGLLLGGLRETPRAPHDPPAVMLIPPALLATATVACGVGGAWWAGLLGTLELPGAMQHASPAEIHLLPHDATGARAFGISVAAMVLGAVLYRWRGTIVPRARSLSDRLPLTGAFDFATDSVTPVGAWFTRLHYDGRLTTAVLVSVVAFVVCAGGSAAWALGMGPLDYAAGASLPLGPAVLAAVVTGAASAIPFMRNRLAMIATLSVTGYGVSLFWVFFQAPDLALTQLLIETITLFLLLAAFRYLPPLSGRTDPPPVRPALRWGVAVLVGALVAYLVLAMGATRPIGGRIGHEQLRTTHLEAGGANAVNTIIVDYRGSDTLGEVGVLVLAALGVAALLAGRRREVADGRTL